MKTVLVTGVSSGLGKEIVIRFLEKKYSVIGLSRTIPDIKSDNFIYLKTDIRSYKSVQQAFSSIRSIDLLVNNASVFKTKSFVEFNQEEIDNLIDTNIKGTIYCTLEALKIMNRGRIINIGSVSGTHGIENQAVYSATKYALNGFSESLSKETINNNILISTICPGGIDTPLWNKDNVYNGDTDKLLNTKDLVNMIEFIENLPDNVVFKTATIFPSSESH